MHGARTIGAAAGAILLALSAVPQLAQAQALREITFVQPSPSAINSFPIYVAIGEGYFADEGLDVTGRIGERLGRGAAGAVGGSGPVRPPRTGAGARAPAPAASTWCSSTT